METLAGVAPSVRRPDYDRSALRAGIVHIGVGGFHRAHMAMALDGLIARGGSDEWAICGVGLLESDRRMKVIFDEQDCLYTLTLKHADGSRETSVIGSIVEYLFAPDDGEAVIEKMADPAVRIVSLTITEGGYNFDRVTGEFDAHLPEVVADLQEGATPTTVFGFVTAALRRRRDRGVPPFTVMSCDNIQGNGHMAKRMFVAYATLKDADLGQWIEQNVAFPNSMVDRITPVTSPEDIAAAAEQSGVIDQWPVVCEPFFQWVIEDDFPTGRPDFARVGAQVVSDVEPYELMKLRLLNASHQGLCYFGFLSGYRYAHEAVGDPLIAEFLRRYMNEEATPTLLPVPGVDLGLYKRTLIDRFLNAEVRDTLARLCAESSDRIPKWLVPVIREQLRNGGSVAMSAAIVASWARYAEAVDENGDPIIVVDALSEELTRIAKTQSQHPLAFIENQALFGDLADEPRFVAAYSPAVRALHSSGARETLRNLLRTPSIVNPERHTQ
ncbi:mannitol dehydrogenase family protein [Subtercola boreus]|uniref:Mannitol-1-phosphate 5-dehydrogenase n=1 Tax=Subtercola boreus TaxID=120213 RepID=A0A3E0W746_9MICO|nr:mannitol dehydrogenase family protein [Subtercola boreus]RFA17557.1 mannitol dehydrogenase [Subtercola boreus]RFA17607.1 mannitol dehydrogenase [Subtercola boreus]RFA24198.1 mannitol dehydrogenase [Subtercola boreus]